MIFDSDFLKLYEELNKLNEEVESASFIDNINSPEDLLAWMEENITYELANDEYGEEDDPPTKTAEEVLATGTGHCAEQSYLEKKVLDELGYETQLIFVKENNSKDDYGADGSAHVFLTYQDDDEKYFWFEHSMEHAKGIHKFNSFGELLQDVATKWWRYDENSDILEVRFLDKQITGVNNWELAQACHEYPVDEVLDISNNVLEKDVPQQFDPPYNAQQIKDNYGEELYKKLSKDPAHVWRMETGLELIHREPEIEELRRIWTNWQLMDLEQKEKSDEKSVELFGKTNAEHYKELISTYKESLTEQLYSIEYRPLSDIELFKKYAAEILGGYGGLSDSELKSGTKEIYIDGKLVGYIGFSEYEEASAKCLGIGNFMIIERGKGLGTKVVQDIVERNKSKYDLIYCFVDAKNEGAIRLYKKLGKVYDEDSPNDNGEYYVTFYDNGKWELDESLEKETGLVFLSDKNMNGKTLTPRVPNNFLIKNGYEDSVTPRVCFAGSIDKALMAISRNLKDEELYVHQPKNVNKKAIYKPTIKEVPDEKITGEVWYTEPVELECVGKIHVIEDDGKDGLKYTYGDKTAELYGWNWEWLEN